MAKVAFITGITGQDGSYLAELLLKKNYKVYGIVRRNSAIFNYKRIDHLKNNIQLIYADLIDGSSIQRCFTRIINENPTFSRFEVYNLAAQSHVHISYENPEYTALVDGIGTLKILEIIMTLPKEQRVKLYFYQAGTSEMYGNFPQVPQNEKTPFAPISPYACAKVYSYHITKVYREAYGLFATNGILFNHESPRRGDNFVTQKIVKNVKDIVSGKKTHLILGNLDSWRDWGHAKDYVYGMWLMLQHDKPDDFVLSTGITTSVRLFVELCFKKVGRPITWEGKDLKEVGKDSTGKILVKIDKKYVRPTEVNVLLGDSTKAIEMLKWKPKYDLDALVKSMFEDNDYKKDFLVESKPPATISKPPATIPKPPATIQKPPATILKPPATIPKKNVTISKGPLVSVIISSYNRFNKLINCIQSIKEQSYNNIEIIVVNDCSEEKEYLTNDWSNIKIIHLKENTKKKFGYQCLGYCLNIGLQQAIGEYITFCDDDFTWLPDKLKLQINEITNTKKYNMCSSDLYIGNNDYSINENYIKYNRDRCYYYIKELFEKKNKKNVFNNGFPRIWNKDFLQVNNSMIYSSVLIKKKIIDEVGTFSTKNIHTDYDYWLRCLVKTECIYLDTPTIYLNEKTRKR